ncbi:MAG: hydantoinase/oxoprolinase family protein, partial [Pseudomonadota bacterium]
TALSEDATAKLEREQIPPDDRHIDLAADARYRGQAYEITVPWPEAAALGPDALEGLCARFHQMHLQRFSHHAPDDLVEIVALRAVATGRLAKHAPVERTKSVAAAAPTQRKICLNGVWQDVPCLTREDALAASEPLAGPLVITEDYTALLITPGWELSPLGRDDLMARREREDA